MKDSHFNRMSDCERPGRYRIVVKGCIHESWSDRLAGMSITAGEFEDGEAITTLVGYLRDQAQLCGVLNSLYDLHLAILLVEHLGEWRR